MCPASSAALARQAEDTRKTARDDRISPFGNVTVRAPSADTPAKVAAFSGAWYGRWYRGRDSTLVVERITGNTARLVYSWGTPGPLSDKSPPGFRRLSGQFEEDGSLTTSLAEARIVFRMNDDKSITGQYLNGASRTEGAFERRELSQ